MYRQPSLFSTSAEPDAMEAGGSTFTDSPRERAAISQDSQTSDDCLGLIGSGQAAVEVDATSRQSRINSLPTTTAEGSSIPIPRLGQRGVAGGAASSLEIRLTKKHLIHQFFQANLGRKFSSYEMHSTWGSAFRSRTSEINNDADLRITIRNECKTIEGAEHSYYWAVLRGRLHRIVTSFSPVALWEHMRYGWPYEEIKVGMNTEFQQWIEGWERILRKNFAIISAEVDKAWTGRPINLPADVKESRKEVAQYFTSYRKGVYASFLFAKLDGKEYADAIWKSCRPHGAHPYKQVDE